MSEAEESFYPSSAWNSSWNQISCLLSEEPGGKFWDECATALSHPPKTVLKERRGGKKKNQHNLGLHLLVPVA